MNYFVDVSTLFHFVSDKKVVVKWHRAKFVEKIKNKANQRLAFNWV